MFEINNVTLAILPRNILTNKLLYNLLEIELSLNIFVMLFPDFSGLVWCVRWEYKRPLLFFIIIRLLHASLFKLPTSKILKNTRLMTL